MGHIRSDDVVASALAASDAGVRDADNAIAHDVAVKTIRRWRRLYPRWEFVDRSDDILDLCTWALDLANLSWRRPRVNAIAVSRRDDVRRLDALIGPKA
jgi:hypothetical protein